MKHRINNVIVCLALIVATPALAEKVYTNADLERMFGKSTVKSSPTKSAPNTTALPDPLTWLKNRLADEEAHREEIKAAEGRVVDAQAIVDDLEQQLNELRFAYDPNFRYLNRKQGTERLRFRQLTYRRMLEKFDAAVEDLNLAKVELAEIKRDRPYGPN